MRFFLILLQLLCCLFLPTTGMAEDVTIVFSASGYMPFYSGQAMLDGTEYGGMGMLLDLLEEFEKAHPEHSIGSMVLPSVRAAKMRREGEAEAYALSSPFFESDLESRYIFSETIWTTADAVYVLASSPDCPAGPEALKGRTLGVIRGFGYAQLDEGLAAGFIKSVGVETDVQLYRLLLSKRVDAIVGNLHVLPFTMARLGLNPDAVRACDPTLYEFGLSVVVRADKVDFLRDLNAFIRQCRADGVLGEIERRWVGRAIGLAR